MVDNIQSVIVNGELQKDNTSFMATIMRATLIAIFGLSLVWFAGMSNAEYLHNGTHDTRHSLVFPCH
jgi:cobalt transporter subunit CbtB